MEKLPPSIDTDYGRYSGLLQMRVTRAGEELRLATRKEFKAKLNAYRQASDDLLAYIAAALNYEHATANQKKDLLTRRALVLTERIKHDRGFSYMKRVTTRVGLRARDWVSNHPRLVDGLQHLIATGIAPFLAAGIRALVVGTAVGTGVAVAGLIAFLASWGTGQYMKSKKDSRVDTAEEALQAAYSAYTDENRNESMARIARALAIKRKAELRRTLRQIGTRIVVGGSVGGVAGAFIHDLIPPAHGATVHEVDGKTREVPSTADIGGCYGRIARMGGWFVTKDGGDYNVFYYDQSSGTVRFATGGVRNLNEITERSMLELSRSEINTLNVIDRQTVLNPMTPWTERTFSENVKSLFGYGARMSESEMRSAGIYTLSPLHSFVEMGKAYWDELDLRVRMYLLDTGQKLSPIVRNSPLWGQVSFDTVFVAGRPGGLSDQNIRGLYGLIFDRIQKGVDLNPFGGETRVLMDTSMETDENFLEWLFGIEGQPHIYGREDVTVANAPAWYKAWIHGHELGHAVHGLLDVEDKLNDLPVAEREEILREMHDMYDYLKRMRADGARRGFQGWSEEMRQLVAVNANSKDSEIFADLFSKVLTHPDQVRSQAPEFYKFVRGLVNSDIRLRKVVGII